MRFRTFNNTVMRGFGLQWIKGQGFLSVSFYRWELEIRR